MMFKRILFHFLRILLILILVCGAVFGLIIIDNNNVKTTSYSIYSSKLPPVFNNYKIALITDFHNSDNYTKVIAQVGEIAPQIIVIVGDAISMNDTVFDNVGQLINGLTPIAPVYFSSGNHETWSQNESSFLEYIQNRGVNVLNNQSVEIQYKNSSVNLVGYKDIVYADDKMRLNIMQKELGDLYNKIENKNLFNILLFHRANYFNTVADYPYDLVLSGHLHGGQINFPIIREKLLMNRVGTTSFCKGYYRIKNAQMIISGGLEKNYKHIRIFNTPEVVSVTLKYLD